MVYAASNPADPSKIIVKINHPKYQGSREIELDTKVAHNEWLSVAQSQHKGGLGVTILTDQIVGARAGGFEKIKTEGSKGYDKNGDLIYVGYKVWPKLGYQGEIGATIDDAKAADMQAKFGLDRSANILDLWNKEGGQEWWAANGDSINLQWDLAPGSRSEKQLLKYKLEREAKRKQ